MESTSPTRLLQRVVKGQTPRPRHSHVSTLPPTCLVQAALKVSRRARKCRHKRQNERPVSHRHSPFPVTHTLKTTENVTQNEPRWSFVCICRLMSSFPTCCVVFSHSRAQSRQTNLLLLELSLLLSATSLCFTTKACNKCSLSLTTSLATVERH